MNTITRPSTPISSRRGTTGRIDGDAAAERPRWRTAGRAPPPAAARTRLSVRSCRTIRDRLAPSAVANGDLPLTRRGAREQQVRDVRARDEQHEGDGREQDEQSARLGDGRRSRPAATGAARRSRCGSSAGTPRTNADATEPVQIGLRRGDRHAGLQPPERRRSHASRGCRRSPRRRPRRSATTARSPPAGNRNPAGMTPTTSDGTAVERDELCRRSPDRRRTGAATGPRPARRRPSGPGRSSPSSSDRPSAGATPSSRNRLGLTAGAVHALGRGSAGEVEAAPCRTRRSRRTRGCARGSRRIRRPTPRSRSARAGADRPRRARGDRRRGTGSGRRMTASTTLKMAVLAPMPSASVRMTTAAKPGDLPSVRSA